MIPDGELLRRYTETNSESAFRELVERHLALVYSAALRQVNGDAHLAQDVAQTVFADLARKAASLVGRPVLTGWLYTTAHFAAVKAVRTERRRQTHEEEAQLMNQLLCDPAPDLDWEKLRPVLDAAMVELNETDREAVLLRYFDNRPHAEIAARLGLSENAARMKVERALAKLHGLLQSRGINTTATLSAVLLANAVQVAPAGLAAALSTAVLAGTTLAATATVTVTESMIMTLTQKLAVVTILAASVLTPALVQHRAQIKLAAQASALQRQANRLAGLQRENQHLADLLALATSSSALPDGQFQELLRLRGQIGRLNREVLELTQRQVAGAGATTNLLAATERVWSERADQLKQWLEANSTGKIPELKLLSDQDWIESIHPLTLSGEPEYRRAMSNARANAEGRVLDRLHGALRQYGQANNGQFPSALSQLATYLTPPIDDSILNRYEIVRADSLVSELQLGEDWVITQKNPVDGEWDARQTISLTTGGLADSTVTNRWRQTR